MASSGSLSTSIDLSKVVAGAQAAASAAGPVAKAGAKGLLVPDIPLEETPELSAICAKNGVDLVLLSTPTTPEARMTKIAEASNGFIYLVSVTGVTGVRTNVESRVQELVSGLKKVRSHTGSHTTAFAW